MKKFIVLLSFIFLLNCSKTENYSKIEYQYVVDIAVGRPLLNIEGIGYEEKKEYKKAEKYFKDAIEENDKLALNNLANVYATQRKYRLAETYYKKAIEEGIYLSALNISLMYEEEGKYELADKYKKIYENKK